MIWADSAWNWYWHINWSRAGGAAFVQLTTGINLASLAWDNFRNKLQMPQKRCEEIIDASRCNIIDTAVKNNLEPRFIFLTSCAIFVHRIVLLLTYCGAGIACFAGWYMLYSDRYCMHDWWLATPNIFYLVIVFILFILFKICIWFLSAFGKLKYNGLFGTHRFKRQISDLETQLRRLSGKTTSIEDNASQTAATTVGIKTSDKPERAAKPNGRINRRKGV